MLKPVDFSMLEKNENTLDSAGKLSFTNNLLELNDVLTFIYE